MLGTIATAIKERLEGLAAFKVPDQIVFVDVLNETPALKVSRKALRAKLRERLQAQETAGTPS